LGFTGFFQNYVGQGDNSAFLEIKGGKALLAGSVKRRMQEKCGGGLLVTY